MVSVVDITLDLIANARHELRYRAPLIYGVGEGAVPSSGKRCKLQWSRGVCVCV